jgi:hypothetical protein
VASDTNLLRDMFADWALTLRRHALTLVAMLAVMFMLNWQLALVVAATLPPLLGVIFWLNRRVKASVREQRRHEGRMTSRLNEVLSLDRAGAGLRPPGLRGRPLPAARSRPTTTAACAARAAPAPSSRPSPWSAPRAPR